MSWADAHRFKTLVTVNRQSSNKISEVTIPQEKTTNEQLRLDTVS